MRLHGGGVDEHLGRRTAGARQGMEEIDPDALGGPPDIAVVKRLARPVIGRRIDPAPTGLQDMDYAADHPAVVNTRLATRIRWQMRLDPRKLRFRQPETVPIHPRFLPEAVNHTQPAAPTILWVRTLVTDMLPDYAEAWRERGIAENKLAGTERAEDAKGEASLRRSIALNANDFDAHASLGGILKRAGRLEEALESYEASNRYSNSHPYPFLNMLKLRVALRGSLDLTGEDVRTLRRARRLRLAQSDAKQDEPWSHFDAAELCLLGGDILEAGRRLELGLDAHTAEFQVATFRQSLSLLAGARPPIDGLQAILAKLS